MKKYNVSVPKKYMKDGAEKTAWKNVGTLIRFDATKEKPEGFVLELNMFPETKFGVFEDKPREEKVADAPVENMVVSADTDPDSIPF